MTTPTPRWRIPLLALVWGGTLVTLVNVLWWTPARTTTRSVPPELTVAIALHDWHLQRQETLPIPREKAAELRAANRYHYRQAHHQMTIELRYLEKSDTNVRNLLLQYDRITPTVPFEATIRQNTDGYYSLFTVDEMAYLSSCINPQGGTTVTAAQFTHNRYTYDLRLNRVIPILLGQASLQDSRCLWTYMALPLTSDTSREDAYPLLETTWEEWQALWQRRFPDS